MTKKDAFERVTGARHPERPYTSDIIEAVFTDFTEIHGDRRFSDDSALICGFAKLEGFEVAIIGQQKGRDTNARKFRNFGMPKPEGYRKALRLMYLAEKFRRPLISFVDTPGAYPGIDAEERGQAEAIAFNLREMSNLKIPTIAAILGEGGSGGALAIAVGDRVLMLENAVYSVITPEGCAAILWKDAGEAPKAAECLRLTASDLIKFGIIDEIIPEDKLWNYNENENKENLGEVTKNLKNSLLKNLKELSKMSEKELLNSRYEKFRKIGSFVA